MIALLILPVLVAGFFAFHIHPLYRYKLYRFEGQYLYLKSAQFGCLCLFLALILSWFLHNHFPDSFKICNLVELRLDFSNIVEQLFKEYGVPSKDGESKRLAWIVILSFLMFVAAFLVKCYGHVSLRIRVGKFFPGVEISALVLEDSPLDFLLWTISISKTKLVMLTMDDRKVYVGKIVTMGEPSETTGMDQEIVIIPVMSGYRDKDTLSVKFTTQYKEINKELQVCLRQESIVSATEFDFDAYRKWNPEKLASEKAKPRVKLVLK